MARVIALCTSVLMVACLTLPGTATAAFPGENGVIYFVQASENQVGLLGTIWRATPDGKHVRRLSAKSLGATLTDPVASPDGKTIAFGREQGKSNTIWTMDADGSHPQQIKAAGTDASTPAFSPDGKQIAFAMKGELAIADVDGSHLEVLTSDGGGYEHSETDPSFFPNGKTIAFDVAGTEIWTINVASGQTQKIGRGNQPDVSADGEKIVSYCGDNQICVMNADGGGSHGVGSGYMPAFSPDGKRIVAKSIDNELTVRRSSGKDKTTLVPSPGHGMELVSPSWAPRQSPAPRD